MKEMMDETYALLIIHRLARSVAGTGSAVKVYFKDDTSPPVAVGNKAEGYVRHGKWVSTQSSSYKVVVGVRWPAITSYFIKFPNLIRLIDFDTPPKTKPAPVARAIKL